MFSRRIITASVLVLLLLGFGNKSFSQSDGGVSGKPNVKRLIILGASSAAVFVYAYGIENTMWWKGEKSSFHFNWKQDWTYALGSDKYGHFFFGYFFSTLYSAGLQWCNIPRRKSLFYSSLISLAYQTFIEVRDGFSKNYGFSWGDFTADFIGSFLPYFRERVDFIRNLQFKISFYPSEKFKNNSNRYITDDYESTFDWATFPLNKILPGKFRSKYFDFLNLALGHSVTGLGTKHPHHRWFLSLDFNAEALHIKGKLARFILRLIDFYHLPAPAVQIYPNTVWYGLKF